MIRTLDASQWTHHEPQGKGKRSCLIPIPKDSICWKFELRSSTPALVNAITLDGLTIFLGSGQVIELNLKAIGIGALEVITEQSFCYQMRTDSKWYEIPDPIPLKVAVDSPYSPTAK